MSFFNNINEDDYYDYKNSRHECKECLEKDQLLDEAHGYLEEIVKQLYSRESLDRSILEHCLDELCFLLKVKMNTSDLNIVRPKEITLLNSWVEFNNTQLSKLANII